MGDAADVEGDLQRAGLERGEDQPFHAQVLGIAACGLVAVRVGLSERERERALRELAASWARAPGGVHAVRG